MHRRIFLKSTMVASTVAVVAAVLTPRRIIAAWSESAFESSDYKQALKLLLGDTPVTPSPAVRIDAPSVYDSGAQVPVTISSDLEHVDTMVVLSENNPFPLIARFDFTEDMRSVMSTRIKLAGKTNVIAVVGTQGRYFSTKRSVKVTVGGCA